jgi:hypothetical protein
MVLSNVWEGHFVSVLLEMLLILVSLNTYWIFPVSTSGHQTEFYKLIILTGCLVIQ